MILPRQPAARAILAAAPTPADDLSFFVGVALVAALLFASGCEGTGGGGAGSAGDKGGEDGAAVIRGFGFGAPWLRLACAGIDIFGAVAERVRKLAITLPGQRHHLLGVVVWIEAIEELRGRGAARTDTAAHH